MSEHTKGPWRMGNAGYGAIVADHEVNCRGADNAESVKAYGGHMVAESVSKANALRIIACVNACEGIPTYQLFVEDNNPNNLGAVIDSLRQKILEAEHKIQEIEESGTYFNAP